MASEAKAGWAGGEVLFAGGTDWSKIARGGSSKKQSDQEKLAEAERKQSYPDQLAPVRLKSLMGVKIMFVAAGAGACHSIIGDEAGQCYTWGRNERGQLGHGDLLQRNVPTIVKGLKGMKVIAGAGGKHHSAVVTSDGESYTFGSNLHGQCGTGTLKSKDKAEELIQSPALASVSSCTDVSCGNEFTMWLCEGKVFSAGLPQYGQLGHNTDHEYNAKDSSVKLMYQAQPQPRQIQALAHNTVTTVACGQNHTLALTKEGQAFTWGNGGYGRLGHVKQQDEFKPRNVETFSQRVPVAPDMAACSTTASFCVVQVGPQVYAWGKWKSSGDNTMYPKAFADLQGWNVRHMAAGATHYAVAADESTITWGQAQNGELGYGPEGKKSSANPDKVHALEGVHTHQVACGIGHTLFLVKPGSKQVEALEVFEPAVAEEEALPEPEAAGPAPKGKGKAAASKGKGKAASGKAAGGKRKADEEEPAPKARGRAKK
ncbi:hypothetical protein ABBQ38_002709 [Trebouxia sp. C0009 RCD-2024]